MTFSKTRGGCGGNSLRNRRAYATIGRRSPRSLPMSKCIVLFVAFALTFCAGVIVSQARHRFGAPSFPPVAGSEPDVLDLVAALRAKGIRLEPVATAPYRSPAKAA